MKGAKAALLLVDLQNDFFPGGALGVPGAEAIFPLANDIQDHFEMVIASRDWHPADHKSFAKNHPGRTVYEVIDLNGLSQVLWPDHCVQETKGSLFHPKLRFDKISKIIFKGTDPTIDSYSAFFDNAHQKSTGLDVYLETKGINTIYIMGLATDYCVQYSVLDAADLGLKVFVIEDGCYGINKNPDDVEKAYENMRRAGAIIIKSAVIMQDDTKIK